MSDSVEKKLSIDTLREPALSDPPSEILEKDATKLEANDEGVIQDDTENYISGLPLYGAVGAITLTCFLMFLDLSIVATVSLFFRFVIAC
jgi:hypothetical protein